jgi:sugar phosphate isomerase/epimerase
MLLYARTQMLPQFSYTDAIDFIMRSGFDGVEISIFDKNFSVRPEFFMPGFVKEIKDVMKRSEVKGFSVSAHKDYTESAAAFVLVLETLKIASELGAEYVIINGAIRRTDEEFGAQWEKMIKKTKILADAAGELGLKLAVEYEPGFVIDNTELLLKAFKEIDSKVLGINCDIGHIFLCDADPMLAIEKSAPYILQCHVENMAKGVHDHLVPWQGDMNLPEYIAKLKSVGFNGAMALDLYKYEYADVCAKSAEYLRRLL